MSPRRVALPHRAARFLALWLENHFDFFVA